ncbi:MULTISPECIES: hypothetical protein [Klebsiella]|uniref:hypothetical protein n=1 Tax=Klebsiella TaxID=570 RepID=UPI0006500CD5|nr:hypothetical protein [Klebsiella michiganensis]KMK37526.1 hypothetical protein ABW14_22845 [Klebsiella michiganensis]UTJ59754.1 hypothetical protein NLZ14_12680 [Klebsiella michiganensis]
MASDQVGENSLSVSFKLAVNSINLSVERGKTMPILGKSFAGILGKKKLDKKPGAAPGLLLL